MTALIIEDEIPAGKRLERLLGEQQFTILGVLRSVKEAVSWFRLNNHPDLVFMDIKLRDGLCFRIFEKTEVHSKIVFTTAFDEYALKAFDYNSLDYLLKPIDENKLGKLVAKIGQFRLAATPGTYWKELESALHADYQISFLVVAGAVLKKIMLEEIVCFYSENNSSFIIANNGRQYPVNQSLEKIESRLPPDACFRISRKCIACKKYIHEVVDSKVVLSEVVPGLDLKISGSRLKSFLEFYKK